MIEPDAMPASGATQVKATWAHHDELPEFPTLPGITMRVISGPTLMTAWIRMEPNTALPMHQHSHEQLGVVIEGAVRLTIDGETRALGVGHAYNVPSQIAHGGTSGDQGCLLLESFTPPRDDYIAKSEEARAAQTAS